MFCILFAKDYIQRHQILFFLCIIMKIFWTTIFWLVVFFLVVFYLKTFDDTMGSRVASWISPTTVVTISSGVQDPVLSGIITLQTSIDDMRAQLDSIAQKVGVSGVVSEEVVVPTPETPAETK